MPVIRNCDTLIRNARVIDGSGGDACSADVALCEGRIAAVGDCGEWHASVVVEAGGLVLCPGFVDTHTHEDLSVIRNPAMLSRLTQGVTTIVAGNCGISAAPVQLRGELPDPMNLLGDADDFRYPTFASYVAAVEAAAPAVNVAAFAGHTALRNNHLDRLDRAATPREITAMRTQLSEALANGALGTEHGAGLCFGAVCSNAGDTGPGGVARRSGRHLCHAHAYGGRWHSRRDGRSLCHRPAQRCSSSDLAFEMHGRR